MKKKKAKVEVTTEVWSAKKNRDSICLLGGAIYGLTLKLNKKKKITKGDLKELRMFLARIDKYDQKIWNQILTKHFKK